MTDATDPIAAARALIAAQPDLLFRCDLCPDECNCHPHHDMSMSGEYILCDGCEDFYNPKGVPDPLTLIATLADSLEAERAKAAAEIDRLTAALEDIYQGEPEWPDHPQKELDWCRNRAHAALPEPKEASHDD